MNIEIVKVKTDSKLQQRFIHFLTLPIKCKVLEKYLVILLLMMVVEVEVEVKVK
jgi:hypothetical protein